MEADGEGQREEDRTRRIMDVNQELRQRAAESKRDTAD